MKHYVFITLQYTDCFGFPSSVLEYYEQLQNIYKWILFRKDKCIDMHKLDYRVTNSYFNDFKVNLFLCLHLDISSVFLFIMRSLALMIWSFSERQRSHIVPPIL